MTGHLLAFNPVRARLVASPRDWLQASVRADLAGRDDALVTVAPALARVGRFAALLELTLEEQMLLEGLKTKAPTDRRWGRRRISKQWNARWGER